MSTRVKWEGRDTPYESFLTLLNSPVGTGPIAKPAGNGIQEDDSLRFTNTNGDIEWAKVGDVIVVSEKGWTLEPGGKDG